MSSFLFLFFVPGCTRYAFLSEILVIYLGFVYISVVKLFNNLYVEKNCDLANIFPGFLEVSNIHWGSVYCTNFFFIMCDVYIKPYAFKSMTDGARSSSGS